MRKENIIIPEGEELLRYLSEGYAFCNDCGAVMDLENDIYVCPACGSKVDYMDYEYEDDEAKEWTPEMLKIFGEKIPEGCLACGGPYPNCKTSCKLFDD